LSKNPFGRDKARPSITNKADFMCLLEGHALSWPFLTAFFDSLNAKTDSSDSVSHCKLMPNDEIPKSECNPKP
ncbi:hypothetical protein ACFLQR_03140, partial [Verrucomicrobiota bacterium]